MEKVASLDFGNFSEERKKIISDLEHNLGW